jgi:hypothetical protein
MTHHCHKARRRFSSATTGTTVLSHLVCSAKIQYASEHSSVMKISHAPCRIPLSVVIRKNSDNAWNLTLDRRAQLGSPTAFKYERPSCSPNSLSSRGEEEADRHNLNSAIKEHCFVPTRLSFSWIEETPRRTKQGPALQLLLGHSKITMTARYAHALADVKIAAVSKLDLAGFCSPLDSNRTLGPSGVIA